MAALTALESNTVSLALQQAKVLLSQVKPVLDQINTIYNSSGGAGSTITQEGLDAIPSFSGLTKQQLDDGVFALTSGVLGQLNNSFNALAELSARA